MAEEINWDDYIFIDGVPIAEVDWANIAAPTVEVTVQWDGKEWIVYDEIDKIRLMAVIKPEKD